MSDKAKRHTRSVALHKDDKIYDAGMDYQGYHTTPPIALSTPQQRRARLNELSQLIDCDDENYGDHYAEWIRLWPVVFADKMLSTLSDKPTSYRDDPICQVGLVIGSFEVIPFNLEPDDYGLEARR